ncbi:MAG: hypothetical protein ACJ741_02745 [Pyrinomonadaceae bacterium]
MPVIGRLDRQVNDVLIEPTGQNRKRDGQEAPAAPDDAPPDASREDVSREEDRSRDEELPVWLL